MTARSTVRVAYLDGRRLQRLFLAGITRLTSERAHLDRINVFPVPDGDTGTNLALTFAAVADRLAGLQTRHAGELLAAAADAALDGARGNSGAIFTEYLQGLATALEGQSRIRPAEFNGALASAARQARQAIQNPLEGTVLSVMSAIALPGDPDAPHLDGDFVTFMEHILRGARASVTSTRNTLTPQRDAGVEDAGALGFLTLLEGLAEALQPGLAPLQPVVVSDDAAQNAAHHADHAPPGASGHDDAAPEHRYCTECLITGANLDREALKAELSAVGSSVAVVGGVGKLRLHVHVNDPQQAFAIARRYGSVTAEKADDMRRQERSLAADGRHVAIVTDSAADLPPEVLDEFGIQIIPLRVNFGTRSYLDKTGLKPAEFYRELRQSAEHPRTSQPPPGDFRRAFELLSSHFDAVVAISLASRLSGTHQGATAAAARIKGATRILVLDSQSASVGQGLIVLAAAEAARLGLDAEAVAAAARDAAARTRTYGYVPDLSYALRGGRIARAWRWLAEALPLSFVVGLNNEGGIGVRGVALRGTSPAQLLLRAATRGHGRSRPGEAAAVRIAIAHADVPAVAEQLAQACAGHFGTIESLHITDLGPAFAVHGGPGALALAVQALGRDGVTQAQREA